MKRDNVKDTRNGHELSLLSKLLGICSHAHCITLAQTGSISRLSCGAPPGGNFLLGCRFIPSQDHGDCCEMTLTGGGGRQGERHCERRGERVRDMGRDSET